jgi:hypothetical protein
MVMMQRTKITPIWTKIVNRLIKSLRMEKH